MAEPKIPTEEELLNEARALRATVQGFTDFANSDAVPAQWRGKALVLVGEMHEHVNSNVTGYLTAMGCAATGKAFRYGIEADEQNMTKAVSGYEGRINNVIANTPDLAAEPALRQVAAVKEAITSRAPRAFLNTSLFSTMGKVVPLDPMWQQVEDAMGMNTFTEEHEEAMANAIIQQLEKGPLMGTIGALHLPGVLERLQAKGIPVLAIDAAGKLPSEQEIQQMMVHSPEEGIRFLKMQMMRNAGLTIVPNLGKEEGWAPDKQQTHTVETYRRAVRAAAEDMAPELKEKIQGAIDKHIPKNLKDKVPEEASVQPPAQDKPGQEQQGFRQLVPKALREQLAAPLQGTQSIGSYASTPAKPLSPNERIA
jgi:hypothetical protein